MNVVNRVLICGDRYWNHVGMIKHYLQSLTLNTYPKQGSVNSSGAEFSC
jgi:hypothetical protein